jgi:hypothetical protein
MPDAEKSPKAKHQFGGKKEMSFFNFLKKEKKAGGETQALELPPLPELTPHEAGGMFSEIRPPELPQLEEAGLPPLPTQMPLPSPPTMPFSSSPQPMPQSIPNAPTHIMSAPSPTGLPPLEETLAMRPRSILDELPAPPEFKKPVKRVIDEENIPTKIPGLEIHSIEKGLVPPPPMRVHHPSGPLFVRMDKYREALQYADEIKVTFKEEENLFLNINEIKNARDTKFETLHESLEDIQRKLLFVDKTIFEH